MAKKKKKQTRKKAEPTPSALSPFWAYSLSLLMILFGLFMLIGGFGTGGKLPVGLFHAAYWTVGWAAYLVPIALVYWGVLKLFNEDSRIPAGKLFGMISVVVFASAWFHTAFVT